MVQDMLVQVEQRPQSQSTTWADMHARQAPFVLRALLLHRRAYLELLTQVLGNSSACPVLREPSALETAVSQRLALCVFTVNKALTKAYSARVARTALQSTSQTQFSVPPARKVRIVPMGRLLGYPVQDISAALDATQRRRLW